MPETSKPCSQRTSARNRRDALYAALETAVREDFNWKRAGVGKFVGVGGIQVGTSISAESTATSAKTYPSPILWYEEMTPFDLDAYHAAHRHLLLSSTSTTDSSVSDCHDNVLVRQNRLGSQNNLLSIEGERLQKNARGESAQGGIAKFGQAGIPTSSEGGSDSPMAPSSPRSYIFPQPPQPIRSSEREDRPEDDSVNPPVEEILGKACLAEPEVLWTSRIRPTTPASASEETTIGTRALCSKPVVGLRKRARMAPGVVAAVVEEEKETRWPEVKPRPLSSATSVSSTTASLGNLFSDRPSQPVRGGQKADAEEVEAPDSDASSIGRGMEPSPTPALPPESSQAVVPPTQTMFLPGLPSQLLVTQQVDGGACDNQGEREEEEESVRSEHDLSRSSLPASPTGYLFDTRALSRESIDSGVKVAGKSTDSTPGAGHRSVGSSSRTVENSGHMSGRTDYRKESRAQRYEEFVLALEAFVGETEGEGPDAIEGQTEVHVEREFHGRGSLALVSTEDVLQGAWVGGQAEVVATLESNLSPARDEAPEGYIVRALELARHVLSRPRVCVRVGGRGDVAWGNRQQGGGLSEGARRSYRGEVVGVAGIVWEVLGAEKGVVRGSPAPANAQSVRNI